MIASNNLRLFYVKYSFLFFMLAQVISSAAFGNYGSDSRLVKISFDRIELLVPVESVSKDTDPIFLYRQLGDEKVAGLIGEQLQYLIAAFSLHRAPMNFLKSSGTIALRSVPMIDEAKIAVVKRFNRTWLSLPYSYTDEGVFHKSLFKDGKQDADIKVRIPLHLDGIYQLGIVPIADALLLYQLDLSGNLEEIKADQNEGESHINLCTDLHYNGLGDLWYFWNPYNLGCPQAAKAQSQIISGKVISDLEIPDATLHYKDFLKDQVLDITYIVGVDSNYRNGDYGRETFRKSEQILTNGRASLVHPTVKVKLTEGEKKLLEMLPEEQNLAFQYEKNTLYEKVLVLDQPGYKVRLKMFLENPASEDPRKWKSFVKHASEGLIHSDLFIYDGHSGLGGYLDPGVLFNNNRSLIRNKQQVYFFNGCTTFPYYSQSFFDLKATRLDPKGRKKLDIVTTALGATFTIGAGQDVALIYSLSLLSGNWKEIMDRLYSVFPEESALTYVVTQ